MVMSVRELLRIRRLLLLRGCLMDSWGLQWARVEVMIPMHLGILMPRWIRVWGMVPLALAKGMEVMEERLVEPGRLQTLRTAPS